MNVLSQRSRRTAYVCSFSGPCQDTRVLSLPLYVYSVVLMCVCVCVGEGVGDVVVHLRLDRYCFKVVITYISVVRK